jgi:hypothetical protein
VGFVGYKSECQGRNANNRQLPVLIRGSGATGKRFQIIRCERGPTPMPAVVASIAVGLLFYAVPQTLTVGPRWLPLALVSTLMIGAQLMYRAGERGLNSVLALTGLGVITAGLVSPLGLLVVRLPTHKESPLELLQAAGGSLGQ